MTCKVASSVTSSVTRPPPNVTSCKAWGCPLPGSIDSSTVGAPKWVCAAHHRAPGSQWQRITAELRRVIWLVEAIQMLRHACAPQDWDEACKAARRRLIAAQRSDLVQQQGEGPMSWIFRLEAELTRIARFERQRGGV